MAMMQGPTFLDRPRWFWRLSIGFGLLAWLLPMAATALARTAMLDDALGGGLVLLASLGVSTLSSAVAVVCAVAEGRGPQRAATYALLLVVLATPAAFALSVLLADDAWRALG
jgi:hypothetical protein